MIKEQVKPTNRQVSASGHLSLVVCTTDPVDPTSEAPGTGSDEREYTEKTILLSTSLNVFF